MLTLSLPTRHQLKPFAHAVRKKARILKDGQLTLIVCGAEEAFKWERRVASFLNAVRCAAD